MAPVREGDRSWESKAIMQNGMALGND